ncbi:hypothetical protein PsYK624_172180 [Phanerochaete sordida]|uniref:F-box domain-containing protein n=1 Tax=Phanerochaete sordida TaxID=48140 RepID=A0A9P3GTB5_9APHY|nr:hypothetical protein PsYK624_172180 [Phanerochaete sordida]
MTHNAGADIPPELLLRILHAERAASSWSILTEDSAREWKKNLSNFGLVCKYWAEVVRPILFGSLTLSGGQDLLFLKKIVEAPQFPASSIYGKIHTISVRKDIVESDSWLGHLNWLSVHLPTTHIDCMIIDTAMKGSLVAGSHRSALRALPSLPPGYIKLNSLTLHGLVFGNMAEPIRLLRSFLRLQYCSFNDVRFMDPAPLRPSRNVIRQGSSLMVTCNMIDCITVPIYALSTLACNIVGSPMRSPINLSADAWDATLSALSSLLQDTVRDVYAANVYKNGDNWEASIVYSELTELLSDSSPNEDGVSMSAVIYIHCPEGSDAGNPPPVPSISGVQLSFIFPDGPKRSAVLKSISWAAFQTILEAPSLQKLVVDCDVNPKHKYPHRYHSSIAVLCSLLQSEFSAEVFGFGKLEFSVDDAQEGQHVVTSADILAAPQELIVDERPIPLTTEERARWILCLERGREDFRRDLLARFIEEEKSRDADSRKESEAREEGEAGADG